MNDGNYRIPPYRFDSMPMMASELAEIIDWGLTFQGVPEAWAISKGADVLVGVIDTGMPKHTDLPEPAFAHNMSRSRFLADRDGHATHVAGIIGARGTLKGVAPECHLGYIKGLDDGGNGWPVDLARAIRKCIEEGCDIINLSIGGGYSEVIEAAVEEACQEGILVVAAAGNSGHRGVDHPGASRHTLAVGSYNRERQISEFSARGPELDFACPGEQITSSWLRNRYQTISGTSMAAPFAAGVAALAISSADLGTLTAEAVRAELGRLAVDYGQPGFDHDSGWGFLDISKVLADKPASAKIGPYLLSMEDNRLIVEYSVDD